MAALLGTGCLTQEASPPSPSISWGLGLEIPNEFPGPGPFLEGSQGVHEFVAILPKTLNSSLSLCNLSELPQDVAGAIQEEIYFAAIERFYGACSARYPPYNPQETVRNPGEELHRLEAAALDADKAAHHALSSLAFPASVVEAELQAWFMDKYQWDLTLQSVGASLYDDFSRNNNSLTLYDAFLNLKISTWENQLTAFIVPQFPWGTACNPSTSQLDAASDGLRAKMQALESLTRTSSGHDLSTVRGRYEEDWKPTANLFLRESWWPGIARVDGLLSWGIARMELEVPALPTADEALYLIAQVRNTTRTLTLDEFVVPLATAIPYTTWGQETSLPEYIMALPALRWDFSLAVCT